MKVMQLVLRNQIQERSVEEITDWSVPRIREEIVDVIQCMPQERVSECIDGQTVDVPIPQIQDDIVEVA